MLLVERAAAGVHPTLAAAVTSAGGCDGGGGGAGGIVLGGGTGGDSGGGMGPGAAAVATQGGGGEAAGLNPKPPSGFISPSTASPLWQIHSNMCSTRLEWNTNINHGMAFA
jgi:hypothetical protein